ncbi:unnamed protein product [Closterium sp. NIES-54]
MARRGGMTWRDGTGAMRTTMTTKTTVTTMTRMTAIPNGITRMETTTPPVRGGVINVLLLPILLVLPIRLGLHNVVPEEAIRRHFVVDIDGRGLSVPPVLHAEFVLGAIEGVTDATGKEGPLDKSCRHSSPGLRDPLERLLKWRLLDVACAQTEAMTDY